MSSGPTIVRLARGGTSALDLDTEAGRAFLQERLGFYNKLFFLLSGGFFLVGALLMAAGVRPPGGMSAAHERRAVLLHAATLVVQLLAWVTCSRGRRLPASALRAIDATSLVVACLGFALQSVTASSPHVEQMGPYPRMTLLLILTNVIIARAVFVPSPSAWTAAVSVAAGLPVVAAAGFSPAPPGAATGGGVVALWAALWAVCAAVVATLASRVIYGLREEVREARRLGQYTLEEKLGEGGMGAVYRASHSMLRRPTAVKLLPPDKAGQAALERFEREVQLTARLSHPNTVVVFDYGRTPDGVFYYAMEYLDGINLDVLVREDGPQPPARVVHVLGQVTSALVEAHGIGLVHRDVKPENILLCERGGIPDVAKVVDFGLVKDLERGGAALSLTDVVQGTPLYLSPEAITAPDRVDARGDLYALGAVGYYVLTGRHVFSGATLVEVCSHHLHTRPEPPSARLGRPVPPGLEDILLACLEKDPARRPASALALRDALRGVAGVGEWSEEDARAWWERWRSRHPRRAELLSR
ncbi:MAG TPA: serine/threonine-protein kinase [Vicinamibacteria bacterium]|nr:serine/threonine-protein kinase [Vicinamibacteria bacterium]